MHKKHLARSALRYAAAGIGLAAASYACYVGVAWSRYGRVLRQRGKDADDLLDRFLPVYDVVERHRARVHAPADVTFSAACDMDLADSLIVRAIFKARELILGATPTAAGLPKGLIAQTKALGWNVLAEIPDREIVMGAATQPWQADVVFRPLTPDEFMDFNEPDFVKIAWTLRVDPIDSGTSRFRTETRVKATDAEARRRFRGYWACVSPGIILIRRMMDGPLRAEAARRGRAAHLHQNARRGLHHESIPVRIEQIREVTSR